MDCDAHNAVVAGQNQLIVTRAAQLHNFASFNICGKLHCSGLNQIHEVCEYFIFMEIRP